MAAGAPISDLNVVRGVLSRLKGGGVAAATPGGNIVTLVLSDVADGSWHLVASGPTLGTTPTKSEARSILDRYRLTPLVPSSVRNFLMDGMPAHQEVWASASRWSVLLGDIRTAIEGARVAALREGADVRVIPELLSGESAAAARRLAVAGACAGNLIRRGSGPHRRLVTLFGGETSLVGRGRKGRGGRNRSLALATSLQIAGVEGAAALVAGTDGLDNGSDAAGAYVDSSTVSRAYEMGLDPRMSLEANETAGFFETLGDAFSPGPTGTYVGDVAFVLAPGSDEDRVEEEDDWVIPLPNVS
jgi:hydroxypyruvate reductase